MERSEERGRRTFIDVRKKTTDKDDIYKLFRCKLTDFSKRRIYSTGRKWTSKYHLNFKVWVIIFWTFEFASANLSRGWIFTRSISDGHDYISMAILKKGYSKLSSKCCFIMNLRKCHVYWRKHQNIKMFLEGILWRAWN